jgi:hypothetical protein
MIMNPAKDSNSALSPKRPHLLLLIVPFIWQVVLVPFVNDIDWAPLNIPFPMLWQMCGIVVTSIVIAIVFRFDKKAGLEEEEAEFLSRTVAISHGGEHR